MRKSSEATALSVSGGVPQPPQINPEVAERIKRNRSHHADPARLALKVVAGDRIALGRAITLVESSRPSDQALAEQVVEACLPRSGNSIRVGVTGVPGVGKSSLIEVLGVYLTREKGHKVAVLAVDPSSQVSKGSILGDKSRMELLANDPDAFVRPSPAGSSLGGVARKTRETIILCEAAGFDVVLVETVGVGQSEAAVHSMTDCFLLLMLAGAGDELQGIKRGIMEMADLIAITKAEGPNALRAQVARREYENALHLFPPNRSGWFPKVRLCSAVENEGIEELWNLILEFRKIVQDNGFFWENRREQAVAWLREAIRYSLEDAFFSDPSVKGLLPKLEAGVLRGEIGSFRAARRLLDAYRSH